MKGKPPNPASKWTAVPPLKTARYFARNSAIIIVQNVFTYWTKSRVFLDPIYDYPKPRAGDKRPCIGAIYNGWLKTQIVRAGYKVEKFNCWQS
jgi:hypothetical protein